MEYKIEKIVIETVEINSFPAYLSYADTYYLKVLAPDNIVKVGLLYMGGASIETTTYISTNDWQPCTPEAFYEAAAEAMRRITDPIGLELHTLNVEGGAYAD